MNGKSSRLIFSLCLIVLAFLLAACGGQSSSSNTTDNNSSSATGSPGDAAKGFVEATLGSEGDPGSFLCSEVPSAVRDQMTKGLDGVKAAFAQANATIDFSGLTYTVQNESGDSAEVVVGGKLKVSVANVNQESDFPSTTYTMKNENGWKVCGVNV